MKNYWSYWEDIKNVMTNIAIKISDGDTGIKIEVIVLLVLFGLGVFLCVLGSFQKDEERIIKESDEFINKNWLLMIVILVMTLGIFSLLLILDRLLKDPFTKGLRGRLMYSLLISESILIVAGIVCSNILLNNEGSSGDTPIVKGWILLLLVAGMLIESFVALIITKLRKGGYYEIERPQSRIYDLLDEVDRYSRYGFENAPHGFTWKREKEVVGKRFLKAETPCRGLKKVTIMQADGQQELYTSDWYMRDVLVTFFCGLLLEILFCTPYLLKIISLL